MCLLAENVSGQKRMKIVNQSKKPNFFSNKEAFLKQKYPNRKQILKIFCVNPKNYFVHCQNLRICEMQWYVLPSDKLLLVSQTVRASVLASSQHLSAWLPYLLMFLSTNIKFRALNQFSFYEIIFVQNIDNSNLSGWYSFSVILSLHYKKNFRGNS